MIVHAEAFRGNAIPRVAASHSRNADASPRFRIDHEHIAQALELLLAPGQVIELRALNAKIEGEWRAGTYAGWFDREHIDELIAACERITQASAVYFTPNLVNPQLLGRSFNRARMMRDKEPLTSDRDIIGRRWLLIDVDAVRPANLSATEAEKAAAYDLATAIDYELWEQGFPPGIIGDSGNGAHLMIPVNLPADDGGFCERLLKRLAKQFNNKAAQVDISVHNPARIWKLPGTLVCKGDHAPEIGREWRMSRLMQVCKEVL